ncbi:MAG: glycosyltransferase family 4 protein [Planctomycetaceae bacterium]|jgi:glycosyltransferase involved in cell wall biosynthesis|nr:glycosyltransferase family 4 protein [Planctomycetaceae bacterium]
MKIVHITPHLGTGIGNAYSGITKVIDGVACEHTIVLLEKPEKIFFVERIKKNGCTIFEHLTESEIVTLLKTADIVQINWWHHPLMAKFLYDFPDIPVRFVCWIHVSGCTYPYLRTDFLSQFEQVFFTTPYSYENNEVAEWVQEQGCGYNKTAVIYGLGDVSHFLEIKQEDHQDFRIGYLGTLDFNKLHPDFVKYCAAVSVLADDIKFVMIGDAANKNVLLQQAIQYGIADRFEFRGFCEDVGKELSQLDCVGYLLNPYHFGTTENVILETMAAGVPVILMNQNTEKYIVENNKNGFLIHNPHEYCTIINLLYRNPQERNRIAKNARIRIEKNYSVEDNIKKLYSFYEKTMRYSKQTKNFRNIFGNSPSDWFLHFVEHERAMFHENKLTELPEIFKGQSKSSIKQFATYFPEDKNLRTWLGQLKK